MNRSQNGRPSSDARGGAPQSQRQVSVFDDARGGPPQSQRQVSVFDDARGGRPYGQLQPRAVVGTPIQRLEARAKVTGAATYTSDVRLNGMLYGAVLRSPHASATVRSLDTRAAQQMPGVRGILTFDNTRVRYAGTAVAAVAAETLDQARDALEAINVDYEVSPAVVTLEDAMAADAPQVYETQANVGEPAEYSLGDAEAGLAMSHVVVQGEYRTQVQMHSAMETHSAVAFWEPPRQLIVYLSTQGTLSATGELADHFGLEPQEVRVICEHMGGGFGAKTGAGNEAILAAELADITGLPVQVLFDRRAEQLATGNRPDSIQNLTVGARSDGSLTAVKLIGYGTAGTGSGAGFAAPARSLYDVENFFTSETQVYTNCGPAAAMRAPGHPQGVFAYEAALDELALQLGMDPLDLRLANDSVPERRDMFTMGAARFGWSSRNSTPGADPGPIKRGMGLASSSWLSGVSGGNTVRVVLYPEGLVQIANSVTDIGTGTRTWLAMLVAEELGLQPERIEVSSGDSSLPIGPTSAGSITTASLAPPAREAGELARIGLAEVVAPALGADPADLIFRNGQILAPNGASMSFEAGCALLSEPLEADGTRNDNAGPGPDFVYGVHFVEVEVDVRTGKVKVLRITAVHNGGRILNPLTAESQIHGGVIQGMNYALFEERIVDRALGLVLNPTLEDYKIAGSKDMPDIDILLRDISSGGSYVGALGNAEATNVPTAAAIGNAVSHAIGARMYQIPITPARVLDALGVLSDASARSLVHRSAHAVW